MALLPLATTTFAGLLAVRGRRDAAERKLRRTSLLPPPKIRLRRMSALPPKADSCTVAAPLLDHLIGSEQDRRRY